MKLCKYSLRLLSSAQFYGAALHMCPAEVSTSDSFLPAERGKENSQQILELFVDPELKDALVAALK